MPPVDKKQLKDALLKTLIEKGDYQTVLSHLSGEEKEDKDSDFKELIKPMSAVADILVGNAQGAFTKPLNERFDGKVEELRAQFTEEIAQNRKELSDAIQEAFTGRNTEFTSEILEKVATAQENLTQTITELAGRVVGEKAVEMFKDLGEQARLTEEEIESIVEEAALSVESQMANIIGQYIEEYSITTGQIKDFATEVQKLIPATDFSGISVDYSQIRNAPSQGGTNTNIVRQLITEALADFNGGGGYTNLTEFVDQTPNTIFYADSAGDVTELALGADGTFLKSNGTTSAPSFAVPAGSGDVSKMGTPVNNQVGVWTGDGTIEGDTNLTFDTTDDTLTVGGKVVTPIVRASSSAGVLIEANGGADVVLLGAGGGQGTTFYGGVNIDGATRLATSLTGPLRADSGVVSVGTDNAGITRTVASVATPTTAGATALTDYVYFVTNTTLTLPTAVGNTNRYTVKCISGTCVVDGHSTETIDGTATITFNAQSSVDLISDGTNFNVV